MICAISTSYKDQTIISTLSQNVEFSPAILALTYILRFCSLSVSYVSACHTPHASVVSAS